MDTLYNKLNKKLDSLIKQTQNIHNDTKNTDTQPRLINLTNTTFTKEQINMLAHGPNYATEKDPRHYINELIIDTENAIRQMDPKIQNTLGESFISLIGF
jgi:hypothetical protein